VNFDDKRSLQCSGKAGQFSVLHNVQILLSVIAAQKRLCLVGKIW